MGCNIFLDKNQIIGLLGEISSAQDLYCCQAVYHEPHHIYDQSLLVPLNPLLNMKVLNFMQNQNSYTGIGRCNPLILLSVSQS